MDGEVEGKGRLIRALVLACALLAAAPASGDEGGGGASGTETVKDAQERVSVELTTRRQRLELSGKDPRLFDIWTLDVDGDSVTGDIVTYVFRYPESGRAALLGSMGSALPWGKSVPGTGRTRGADWIEEAEDEKFHFLVRAVERGGLVHSVVVQSRKENWERFREEGVRISDSFRVLAEGFVHDPPPDGFVRVANPSLEVWTDGKPADSERLVREMALVAAAGTKFLGEPLDPAPLRVLLCKDHESYAATWYPALGAEAPRLSYLDISMRRLVIDLSARADPRFLGDALTLVADYTVVRHFGGRPPDWLLYGLRLAVRIAAGQGGKWDLPTPGDLDHIRTVLAERDRPLSALRAVRATTGEKDVNSMELESYAWLAFARVGTAKKTLGARLEKAIEALRRTGDVAESEKAWDASEDPKLRKELDVWIAKWKPKTK